jgi:exopolyphosphatase/guanosine-5'-triphosphate,3'-diphosphate pyrophosphatase
MHVHAVWIVATAAVREAQDGMAFVARMTETHGIPIRVLSGEEEAQLAALGVHASIHNAHGVVGDLGGGS